MRDIIIYGIYDPRSSELRYVGKTINPLAARLSTHLRSTEKNYRAQWLRSMVAKGITPVILEIARLPHDGDWQAAERYWIAHFRSLGARLINATDGGEGMLNHRPTAEHRKKIGEANARRSPEARKKAAQKRLSTLGGKLKHSDESKAKMSAAQKGRKRTPEQRARMSAGMKGKPKTHVWTAEERAAVSAQFKGKKQSQELIEKRISPRRGRPSPLRGRKYSEDRRIQQIEILARVRAIQTARRAAIRDPRGVV